MLTVFRSKQSMAIAPAAVIGFSLRAAHLVSDQGQRFLSSITTIAAIRMRFEKRPIHEAIAHIPEGSSVAGQFLLGL